MNPHEVRLSILRILQSSAPRKMPEGALKEYVRQLSTEEISETDLQIALNWLEAKNYIDFTKGELGDPEKRWFITEAGKAKAK